MKAKKTVVWVLLAVLLAGVLLSGCGGQKPIRIATKPMTEQFITGEMLALLLEKEGYKVSLTKGIGGGTSNIHPAMEKGEFDLYTEYTGTGWINVLEHDAMPDDETTIETLLNDEYNERFDMSWVGFYGFNNTYTLAVRDEVAKEHSLTTMSQLAAVAPELIFGGNGDFFERPDGFDALAETYGYHFAGTVDIDIGLKYKALESGEIDVTNAFTTDAQLAVAKVVTLQDDKGLFGNYFAGTVVRNDALEKYPTLEDTLLQMQNLLTDQEMADLSYQVEVEEKDERDVAKAFLESKNLL